MPSRREIAWMVFFITLAVISAGALSFSDLVSPYLPSYSQTVARLSSNQTASLSYDPIGNPEMAFHTPLNASIPVWGNITVCCVSAMPQAIPELFIMTSTGYETMQHTNYGTPWSPNVQVEVSTGANLFENYSVNGQTGIQALSIEFTPQEQGVYYFILDPVKGATNYATYTVMTSGTLRLWHYESVVIRPWDQWVKRLEIAGFLVSIIVGAIFTVRSMTKGEDYVKFHPQVLVSRKPEGPT